MAPGNGAWSGLPLSSANAVHLDGCVSTISCTGRPTPAQGTTGEALAGSRYRDADRLASDRSSHFPCRSQGRPRCRMTKSHKESARTPLPRDAKGSSYRGYAPGSGRSEEHTSELQSLMRISYAVFCLKTKKEHQQRKIR